MCWLVYLILAIVVIWFCLWLFKRMYLFSYHTKHPELPRLKRKLLRGYLVNKYGKRQGKKLFKDFKAMFWQRFKIR